MKGRAFAGKKARRWLLAGTVTVLTGYVLLRQMPLYSVLRAWGRIPVSVYALTLILTMLFVWLRALRFRDLSHAPAPAWRYVAPSAAYSLTCRLLPGGTGDLSLPVFLRPLGIGTGASLGMSLVSRLLDLGWALLLGAGLGIWLTPWHISLPLPVYAAAAAVLLLLAAFRLPALRSRISGTIGRIDRPGVRRFITEGRQALAVLDRLSLWRLLQLSGITLLIKLVTAVLYFVLTLGLQMHLGFLHIFFASVMTSLFLAFPIQGIAGLGTEEAWWTLSLQLVGLPLKEAVLLGITFHFMNLLLIAVLGLAPLLRRTTRMQKGEAT